MPRPAVPRTMEPGVMPTFARLAVLGCFLLAGSVSFAQDGAWYDQDPWRVPLGPGYTPQHRSVAVEMSDGARLVASIYLPADATEFDSYPTVLHQTRYWRSGGEAVWGARFHTQRGYAFVSVDVRGTGASTGKRLHDLGPGEIDDAGEILDWLQEQPWCDGRVGTAGGSYTGATAFYAVSHQHPGLLAACPGQIAFDLFEHGFFPGGVFASDFLATWQVLVTALDTNQMDPAFGTLLPLDGPDGASSLREAVDSHRLFKIHDGMSAIEFRDDPMTDAYGGTLQAGDLSLLHLKDEVEGTETAMLQLSGWYDGGLVMGAIHRFLTFPGPDHRLVLGPWDHKNTYISPWRRKTGGWRSAMTASDFDLWPHYARFLDEHVKGEETGLGNEAPVHYFTMGKEEWRSASTWPPEEVVSETWFLQEDRALQRTPPARSATLEYQATDATTSGPGTRWTSIVNTQGHPIGYPDREEQQPHLLTFTTAPLVEDLEITGHPRLHLRVSCDQPDAALHVYLEEVVSEEQIHYVTEGVLRLSHRATRPAPFTSPVLYHSHERADHQPLEPGTPVDFAMDLYPTSYWIRAGHRLRIGIAGADRDNFARIPPSGPLPVLRIHLGDEGGPRLELPVMPPNGD